MQPKKEEIFVVDELGQHVSLIRVTPYHRADDVGGTSWVEGTPEILTADGLQVTAHPDGSFEVVSTGAKYRPAQ